MTRYIDGHGNSTMVCDQCRHDMEIGQSVYSITYCKVADGYVNRDYDRGEIIVCLSCAEKVSQVLAILGTRYADSLTIREAA